MGVIGSGVKIVACAWAAKTAYQMSQRAMKGNKRKRRR